MKKIFILFIVTVLIGYLANAQYITISEQDITDSNISKSVKLVAPTVTDIDGNVYNTVTIGTQTWMKENLKTTKFNDGRDITQITDNSQWGFYGPEAYCWYNNDKIAYKDTYGALYNLTAVWIRKLCPVGWHVPSDEEWAILANYLGGANVAGAKLKETGTFHWTASNGEATNESGFTALPGGYRINNFGTFNDLNYKGYWWSSTIGSRGLFYELHNDDGILYRSTGADWSMGFCVRCIADTLTSSISNLEDTEELSIFPNPSSSIVHIKNIKSMNLLVSVLDLKGKPLLSKQINSDSFIDISSLKNGIYIVKFVNQNIVIKNKLIKK